MNSLTEAFWKTLFWILKNKEEEDYFNARL